jgi:hypothetical protein
MRATISAARWSEERLAVVGVRSIATITTPDGAPGIRPPRWRSGSPGTVNEGAEGLFRRS